MKIRYKVIQDKYLTKDHSLIFIRHIFLSLSIMQALEISKTISYAGLGRISAARSIKRVTSRSACDEIIC